MANPRQRRKSRSSSYKPISHSRHAKRNLKKTPTIRGPKVLQDAWNHQKTVRQNYAALGLIHTLNPSLSGGIEPSETNPKKDDTERDILSANSSKSTSIPRGFGRITRDEAGRVLLMEMSEEDEECQPEVIDMETLVPEVEDAVLETWTTNLGATKTKAGPINIVQALERISSPINHRSNTLSVGLSGAGRRHSSMREISHLKNLISVYGVDAERMAKDRRLNPEQRTAGELKRALRRAGLDGGERV